MGDLGGALGFTCHFRAWIWAIIVFGLMLVVVGVVVFNWTKAKFT